MSSLNKKDIIDQLESGGLKLISKSINENSSACWNNFNLVVDAETNASIGFVQCINCKVLLVYKNATSTMRRHKCNLSITGITAISNNVTKNDKEKLRDKCVSMCAKDLRPFNMIKGEGFLELAQELLDIGAKYHTSKIDAVSILPHPTTISRHVKEMADCIRQDLMPKIKKAIALQQCAMTCDLWTDNYRKLHYLTVTTSYIEELELDWKLKTNVILTTRFPDITKTGEHILSEIQEQLIEIDISSSELHKITFVTDQGSNIRKAFENYKRIPCIVHCLNTSLRHTLDEKFLNEEAPDVLVSIQSARKIVGYMKRSGLVARLDKTLKQDIETRWNSIYFLLDSLQCAYEEVENILLEKSRQDMMSTYNKQLMEELITFLKVYKNATDDLEKEKEPTLPFVVPWVSTLISNCIIKSTDSEVMCKIKKRAEIFLIQKVRNEFQNIHYIATFLHPSFKELPLLSSEKRLEIQKTVKQMYEDIENVEKENKISSPKKFKEWRSFNAKKDELEKYLNLDDVCEDTNVLMWWKNYATSLPKLAALSKQILCIPASSASSERNFSKAGLLITNRRSTIDPDRVNDLLLIHNNKL